MDWNILFFLNSALLGVGLAMDAFSVSIVSGLNESNMKKSKAMEIAGVFAFFQALMPMLGWMLVSFLAEKFTALQIYIPWVAFALLAFLGGKMIIESLKKKSDEDQNKKTVLGFGTLLVQGVATSIDALSVGFTVEQYPPIMALVCALIIAAITFIICLSGVLLGKKFGSLLKKADLIGGIILIGIGVEILLTSLL